MHEIYVMNSDGSNQTRLTNNSSRTMRPFPAWSPDGTRIASSSSSRSGYPSSIYVMNADGSGEVQLADTQGHDYLPTWSPDGSRIAFMGAYWIQSTEIRALYVANVDGTGQARLTSRHECYSHTWSPDSTRIAFRRFGEIHAMNADGTEVIQLTDSGGKTGAPSWSPDGSSIFYSSGRSGNSEIYRMNSDGSGQTQLTTQGGTDPDCLPVTNMPTAIPWRLLPLDMYVEYEGNDGWTDYSVPVILENGSQWMYLNVDTPLALSPGLVFTEQGATYAASVETWEDKDQYSPHDFGDLIAIREPVPPYYRVWGLAPDILYSEASFFIRFRVASAATPTAVFFPEIGTIDLTTPFAAMPQSPVDDAAELRAYELGDAIPLPMGVELTFSDLGRVEGELSVAVTARNPDLYYQAAEVPPIEGYIVDDLGRIGRVGRFSFGLGPAMMKETTWNLPMPLGDPGSIQYLIVQCGDFHPFLVRFQMP